MASDMNELYIFTTGFLLLVYLIRSYYISSLAHDMSYSRNGRENGSYHTLIIHPHRYCAIFLWDCCQVVIETNKDIIKVQLVG